MLPFSQKTPIPGQNGPGLGSGSIAFKAAKLRTLAFLSLLLVTLSQLWKEILLGKKTEAACCLSLQDLETHLEGFSELTGSDSSPTEAPTSLKFGTSAGGGGGWGG